MTIVKQRAIKNRSGLELSHQLLVLKIESVKSYGQDNTTNGLRVKLLYDPYSYIVQIHNQSIDYQSLHNGVKCQNIA